MKQQISLEEEMEEKDKIALKNLVTLQTFLLQNSAHFSSYSLSSKRDSNEETIRELHMKCLQKFKEQADGVLEWTEENGYERKMHYHFLFALFEENEAFYVAEWIFQQNECKIRVC